MKLAALYLVPQGGSPAQHVAAFARDAEAAGFEAIAFTDHPAPSTKWLANGGHGTLDPFVALAFCAAVTSRLRLLTYVSVLPYRNPLLTARAAFSLDLLSSGRLILTCGVGYLRSEFAALGVDFDARGELFDEALGALAAVWSRPEGFTYEGSGFFARDQTISPGPVQLTPPLWIGGNSAVARERVVEHGVGWAPLVGSLEMTSTSRTASISSTAELGVLVRDLGERLIAKGREPESVEVCVQQVHEPLRGDVPFVAEEQLDWLGRLSDAGATWTIVAVAPQDERANSELLGRYGEEVILRIPAKGAP